MTPNTEDNSNEDGLTRPGPQGGDESHIYSRDASCDTSSIGIDTVTLLSQDFEATHGADLEVKSSANAGTGETTDGPLFRYDGDGRLVEGDRAYLNEDKFQVTVQGPDRLYLQASLPKMFSPDNLYPVVTLVELKRAIDELEERVSDAGIEANLSESKICRIDLCRNLATRAPLSEYRPALRELSFPKTEMICYEDANIEWKNGTRQLLLYDKSEDADLDTDHFQRFEYRLKKARAVRNHLGPETPYQLIRNFSSIGSAFRSAVKTLFPEEREDLDLSSLCEEPSPNSYLTPSAISRALESLGDRGTQLNDTLNAIGILYLRNQESVESFLEALREQKGRKQASRYRKKIKNLGPVADFLSRKSRTVTELTGELRRKLLA